MKYYWIGWKDEGRYSNGNLDNLPLWMVKLNGTDSYQAPTAFLYFDRAEAETALQKGIEREKEFGDEGNPDLLTIFESEVDMKDDGDNGHE